MTPQPACCLASGALSTAVVVVGVAAVAVVWRVIATGRATVWTGFASVMAILGGAALLTRRVLLSSRVAPALAVAVGVGAGVALYAGTRAFVWVVSRWPAFTKHVEALYDQRKGVSLGAALLVSAVLVGPGEELFWRGLVQTRLGELTTSLTGAVLAWLLYVGANAASASLPIVAGAVVSGAVWGALAFWSGGVLAPMACHAVWTGLMVALPPMEGAALGGAGSRRAGRAS